MEMQIASVENADKRLTEIPNLNFAISAKADYYNGLMNLRNGLARSPKNRIARMRLAQLVILIYKDKEYERLEDGSFKRDKNGNLVVKKHNSKGKKYFYSLEQANNKLAAEWGKLVSEKTKKYFENLY